MDAGLEAAVARMFDMVCRVLGLPEGERVVNGDVGLRGVAPQEVEVVRARRRGDDDARPGAIRAGSQTFTGATVRRRPSIREAG
jgi:hypothetical protein